MQDFIEILRRLTAFNTVSSTDHECDQPNLGLIDYAEDFFTQIGFNTQRIAVKPGKCCLYAAIGQGSGGLLLSGHSDTVPCRPECWHSNPWELTVKEDKAYALGADDMKGFLALAMSFAAKIKEQPSRPFGILITVDEETSMQGAYAAVPALKAQCSPDLIVIGEPTSLQPIVAHKGYMARELTLKGKACHSSNPALGLNAIKLAGKAIDALNQLEAELKNIKEPGFKVPYPTLNLGVIRGGDSENRACDEVKLVFDLRPTPQCSSRQLQTKLEAIVAKLNAEHQDCASLRELYPDLDSFSNPDPEIAGLMHKLTGHPAQYVNYCTEASFMQQLGPVVVMGPGSIDQAHQNDEFLPLSEVERAFGILEQLFAKYCL